MHTNQLTNPSPFSELSTIFQVILSSSVSVLVLFPVLVPCLCHACFVSHPPNIPATVKPGILYTENARLEKASHLGNEEGLLSPGLVIPALTELPKKKKKRWCKQRQVAAGATLQGKKHHHWHLFLYLCHRGVFLSIFLIPTNIAWFVV